VSDWLRDDDGDSVYSRLISVEQRARAKARARARCSLPRQAVAALFAVDNFTGAVTVELGKMPGLPPSRFPMELSVVP
jgi:hypothetical protein